MPESYPVTTTSKTEPAEIQQASNSDSGWHIKLKIQDHELTWCIDTGVQVSVIPESLHKETCGALSEPDRELVGAGDVPLKTLGWIPMNLTLGDKGVEERVYVVRGASKLLLGIPAIRSLGLIHEIPGAYSIKTIQHEPSSKSSALRFDTKEDIVNQYPTLFQGLGKLEG